MKIYILLGIFAFTFFSVHSAFGAFMNPKHCGNSSPQLSQGVGGTLNFAVLDTQRGTLGDAWGTGFRGFDRFFVPGRWNNGTSPSLDTRARYLYVTQVVNNGMNKVPILYTINKLMVADYAEAVTSWGTFQGMGLADDKTNSGVLTPVSATNVFGVLSPMVPTPNAPANWGVRGPGVVDISTGTDRGRNPDLVEFRNKTSQELGAYTEFYVEWNGENTLKAGERSTVFAFTSDYPPVQSQVGIGGNQMRWQ